MAHFYGTLDGSRGQATRCGTKDSGIRAVAASWSGAVQVELFHDAEGSDCFRVSLIPWYGSGDRLLVASGKVGDGDSVSLPAHDRRTGETQGGAR